MLKHTRPHLVWVRSTRGPEPQRWTELNEYVTLRMQKNEPDILQIIPLTEKQSSLSIDELAEMFPCHG